MMTVWVLVVLVNFGTYPEVWPGAISAYNLPAYFERESDCWKQRPRVLRTTPRFEDFKPIAATCMPVKVKR